MRTTTFKNRTLVAYEADESFGELVVNMLGVFHGGEDCEAALGEDQTEPEAGE
jgi:toxin ParE1/3/4